MLAYNFRKKYEFHQRSPGRNLDNVSLIFDCFFIVNHQATGVMHKNGEMYTTCSPRLKIGHICQKMLFTNFARFLQNSAPVRILMLYAIFDIFDKMSNFCRGGPTWSNLNNLGQNEQLVKSTNHVQYIFMKCFYKNIIFNNNNFFKSIYIKNNFKKSIYDHKIFFKILKSNMYPIFIF